MAPVSVTALDYAEIVARRVHARSAPVRRLFVERPLPDDAPPPMALLLRGGRGGEVRLKLYLSILWFAANPPYDVTYPARAWASLLDLPDPERNGARRIGDALRWLGTRGLLDLERRPGVPTRAVLCDESGDGSPYRHPGEVLTELQDQETPDDDELEQRNYYFQIPAAFWTDGWAAMLSGRAVAMFLAVLSEFSRKQANEKSVWFAPARAKQRFDLSPDTRSAGFKELVDAGLLSVSRIPVGLDAFDFKRRRNQYTLENDSLDQRTNA